MTGKTALILAAHGARDCPTVGDIIRQWAATIAGKTDFAAVTCAFNQDQPHFREVLDQLLDQSPDINRAVIVPVMTSSGYFADEFLPRSLRQNKCADFIDILITPPLGTHPRATSLFIHRIEQLAGVFDFDLDSTSIIVAGHGTTRSDNSSRTTAKLAERVGARFPKTQVCAAFLDQDPQLEDVAESISSGDVLVIPFLISPGPHAMIDIPARLGIEKTSLNRTATGLNRAATVRERSNDDDAQQPANSCLQQPFLENTDGQSAPTVPRVFLQNHRRILIDRPFGLDPHLIDCILDLANPRSMGCVHLVGAGPGDPELITVKGAQLVASADVILYDRLIPKQLLRTARTDARIISVAKHADGRGADQRQVNRVLVRLAKRGMNVVRLKGGDPFVFGRGFEEYQACRAAGVPCHVIPGVSSAIAAPAAANVPVTHRRLARSVAIVTASFADGVENALDFEALARIDTVVVLMGYARLEEMSRRLITAGKSPNTPAVCIENATTPDQRFVRAELADIANKVASVGLGAPMVTIVGDVAALSSDASESAATCGICSDVALMS